MMFFLRLRFGLPFFLKGNDLIGEEIYNMKILKKALEKIKAFILMVQKREEGIKKRQEAQAKRPNSKKSPSNDIPPTLYTCLLPLLLHF